MTPGRGKRFPVDTQQAASEPGQPGSPAAQPRALAAGLGPGRPLLEVVTGVPLCMSCGFLGCTAASPSPSSSNRSHSWAASDEGRSTRVLLSTLEGTLEGTPGTGGPLGGGPKALRLLWRSALHSLSPAHGGRHANTCSTGISQPQYPGTVFFWGGGFNLYCTFFPIK